MNRAGISALLSHWRRSPLQLFTLLAGLALATALWSGVQAVNSQARASYDEAAQTLGEGQFDQILPRSGDSFAQSLYVDLRRAGWQVSPVLTGSLDLEEGRLEVIGVDPLTRPPIMAQSQSDGSFDLEDVLSDPPVYVNPNSFDLAKGLGPVRFLKAEGIPPDTAIMDVGLAQSLLKEEGQLSRLIVLKDQPLGLPDLVDVAPSLMLRSANGSSDLKGLTDSFHLNLTAFGVLSFAVGIFIVHGAIGLAFEQRRSMIQILRSLGFPMYRLVLLIIVELLILSVLAGLIGMVLGYILAGALLPGVAATLEGLYGAQISGSLQLSPSWWISGILITFLGTGLASVGAIWTMSRTPLLARKMPRAWMTSTGLGRRLQAIGSFALLVVAALLALFGSGLVAGFALLAFLLVGAALALPMVLDLFLRWGHTISKDMKWQWFWSDTRQQLPGLSLALMALLLAMSANIGVSTMVSSFRLTFIGFLDQRLSSELYVAIDRETDVDAFQAFVGERASEVLPIISVKTRIADQPAELFGVRVGPTYEKNWTFLTEDQAPWDEVEANRGVIINEQLARRADLRVGEILSVSADVELPIVGVVGDYGNPIGQVIISEILFETLHPDQTPDRFGLRSKEPEDLAEALVSFGISRSNIINQRDIKAFSLSVFERTFLVTGVLNVLTLAVAAFAIFMNLLTLASMRLPQLAPVWALGLTRLELGKLELIRAVLLSALTALIALPLGLALAWVLLSVVNVEAFGWKLPMSLFPFDYAKLGFFALVAALVAALWPSIKLSRTPPGDLLKVFANER